MKKKKKKVKQEPMDEDNTSFQHQEASSLGKIPLLGKNIYIVPAGTTSPSLSKAPVAPKILFELCFFCVLLSKIFSLIKLA